MDTSPAGIDSIH